MEGKVEVTMTAYPIYLQSIYLYIIFFCCVIDLAWKRIYVLYYMIVKIFMPIANVPVSADWTLKCNEKTFWWQLNVKKEKKTRTQTHTPNLFSSGFDNERLQKNNRYIMLARRKLLVW